MSIPVEYIDRCYAGWLGKVIGVRLGAPIEGWSYDRIAKVFGEVDNYLVDYQDFAADDDTNGPLFFLRALSDYTHTRDVTAEQMGLTWLNYAPYEHGFYWWGGYGNSTEHTAYLNLRAGIPAPISGSVEQNGAAVAEQIGGQIFIDSWGLAIPANPALAAEYAGKAASVSHGGNGIYGGQFIAAAISAAFTERSIRVVLETALTCIPAECEYVRVTRDIMAYYDAHKAEGWRSCMCYIIANWGYDRYPGGCHIIPNTAVMIMSMLYGEGDFSKTITICNMGGWDTDCNVGNVGAIMGVLVGLDGIEYARWRKPINDFLASSSVVGCLNIMDLPDSVRLMANLAYKIQEGEIPEKYRAFLLAEHRFDFALPGSTCAFRVKHASELSLVMHEDAVRESGTGALRVFLPNLSAGDEQTIYHRTYCRPEHFHDSRYDPSFSPILYPGQIVRARVSCGEGACVRACAYARDSNGGIDYAGEAIALRPGEWTTLEVKIPALSGAVIEEAGIKVTPLADWNGSALVYIDWMDFGGKAEYALDFAAERMERWHNGHREVGQMTRLKGIWDKVGDELLGTCADFGEAYTGDVSWRDVEVSCTFRPRTSLGRAGFAVRVQGAIRGYGIWVDKNGVSLAKNENGYHELARCDMLIPCCEPLTLTARAEGNMITVSHEGRELIRYMDADKPYENGMVGLILEKGGHALYQTISVKVL